MRAAVVKSGLRSASRMSRIWVKSKATSRSTRAPDGISPAVGTPWVTRLGLALGDDAAGDDRALGDRVDLPVGGVERRHHQRAAEQAARVADRRDGDVDLAAGAGEGRQRRGDQHRGDVARADLLAGDVDAEPLEQVDDRVLGEGRVAQAVAGVVEADHEPVAEQVVAAHAVDLDEVLDPRRRGEAGPGEAAEPEDEERQDEARGARSIGPSA